MSTTSMLLGRSAAPHVLEHDGRRYEFSALTQSKKTQWERWLLARTRAVIVTLYEGDELRAELNKLRDEALSGVYDFTGELSLAAMKRTDGAVKLASILMGCTVDDVLPLFDERTDEAKHLLDLVVAESLPRSVREASPCTGGPEGNVPPPGT